MKTIFKIFVFLSVAGFIGLVGFSYIGPYFGYTMAPEQTAQTLTVTFTQ